MHCRTVFLGTLLYGLMLVSPVFASSGFSSASSQAGETIHFPPEQILRFAKKVEKIMAEKGAHVAIVARKGRPKSEMPEGMAFTHTAFAVYSQISTKDGRSLPGYAIYNLYQQNEHPDVSDLVVDYPPDFFAGVAELEAGVIIPSPNLQKRLLATITSPLYASLHDARYSVIANPYTLGRQNCTEFVFDVIQASIYQTGDLNKLKAYAKKYFVAQEVNVTPFKLILGSMFSDEVSLSDQSAQPVTATFEKIGDYLVKYDKGAEVLTILPN